MAAIQHLIDIIRNEKIKKWDIVLAQLHLDYAKKRQE